MELQLEEHLHHLRSRATELLFKQDWTQYISLYTHFISLCTQLHPSPSPHLLKSLSSAFSNRAEARHKLRDLHSALRDCDEALRIDPTHLKALVCRGKVLLDLDRYSQAHDCFQRALAVSKSEDVVELADRCRKLDVQSRTGQIDISDWLITGFSGRLPELAEYLGPVEIRRSEKGRRGMFATRSIEAGTPLVITKAVVLGRGILPESADDGSKENARMVLWKDFVDRILDATEKCSRTLYLIYLLSTGGREDVESELRVPDMGLFKPEAGEEIRLCLDEREPDIERILKVLDVNCLNEDAASAKVLGKRVDGYCGVGLWMLPSFVNHSCSPNARRLHIGDWLVMHASRDLKAGEEITFGYFDVLLPLEERRALSRRWGFRCDCERCEFEEKEEEIAAQMEEEEDVVVRLEEGMRRKMMGKKERGFLRASYWAAYAGVYESEKKVRRLGRRVPAEVVVAESVVGAVGGDERVLKAVLGGLKRTGGGGGRWVEVERVVRMGRGVYGKVVRKQGMRALFEQLNS